MLAPGEYQLITGLEGEPVISGGAKVFEILYALYCLLYCSTVDLPSHADVCVSGVSNNCVVIILDLQLLRIRAPAFVYVQGEQDW